MCMILMHFLKCIVWGKTQREEVVFSERELEQSVTACAYMRSRSAGSVDRVSMVLRFYEEEFKKEIRMK